jgi:ADP-ribosylglycohydrolase/protein-tyrosine phosphatase
VKIPFLSWFTGTIPDESPRPLANSYWVRTGRLLAGEYPGSRDVDETRSRIAALCARGIDTFVDLTQDGECEPYSHLLPPTVEHRRLPVVDHGLPGSMLEMQEILSVIATALACDRGVYVHCRAGIGRTGTVVGCHLAASGLDGDAALAELNRLWRQCARSAQWREVPETEQQREFVLEFAASILAESRAAADGATDPLLEESALDPVRRLRERFLGTLLGLATGDALAAPTQMVRPGGFAPVRDLLGGGLYDLPRGAWTDDTALALCLAESLLECRGFDARDQGTRYRRWQRDGYLSATGQCLGITAGVTRALASAQWRRQAFSGSHDPKQLEKDPLTRIAPVVMYWFAQPQEAVDKAAEAARTTCQAPDVLVACRFFAAALHAALSGRPKAAVLEPDKALWLRNRPSARLAAILDGQYRGKGQELLNPAGDALDVLEAALWALHRSQSWREGALLAVNLGGESDSIAALFGQLAGAHHGVSAIPLAWRDALLQREMLVDVADRLLAEAMVGLGELT